MFSTLKKFMTDNDIEIIDKRNTLKVLRQGFSEYINENLKLSVQGDEIVITAPTVIIGSARPKVGRYSTYLPEPYGSFKTMLVSVFRRNLQGNAHVERILNESYAVKTNLVVYYDFPKSFSKKKRLMLEGKPKITIPDVDNMLKTALDCIVQAGLMADDNKVYSGSTEKYWSAEKSDCFELKFTASCL